MQPDNNLALRRSMQLLPEPSAVINRPPSIHGQIHMQPTEVPRSENEEENVVEQASLGVENAVVNDGETNSEYQVTGEVEENKEEQGQKDISEEENVVQDTVVVKEEEEEEVERHDPIPEETTPEPPKPVAAAAPAPVADSKPKSWASLFHSNAPVIVGMPVQSSEIDRHETTGGKPMAKVTPFNQAGEESKAENRSHALTRDEMTLVDYLKTHKLNHKSTPIRPRGLKNRSNWCFVNAIMQALIACPPFFNFMHYLPLFSFEAGPAAGEAASAGGQENRWPILRAVWHFLRDVEVQTHFPNRNRGKNKKQDDISLGRTVEATTVLNSLLELSSDNFKVGGLQIV